MRALGLRRGLRWTQNLQCCPETPRRRLNGDPGVPKCAPRLPKVLQRGHKGPQKRDKRSAMRSPEHALALQSAFKGVPYAPKLPINRTSGHYVSNICCSIISTITIRIIITIIKRESSGGAGFNFAVCAEQFPGACSGLELTHSEFFGARQ